VENTASKPIGLFDMDGTLFAFHDQLIRDLETLRSPDELPITDLFDDNKPWLKARMNLIKGRPGWWRDLPKLQLGWHVYHMAEKIGYQIQILTKGPRSNGNNPEVFSHHAIAWAEKVQCIDKHFGPNVAITIVSGNKAEINKAKSGVYGRFLVEDYPDYLDGWLEHRSRGLGIMIHNESNAHYTHPNVVRYDGSPESCIAVQKALVAAYNREDKQHWKDLLE
jgi:5'-nucleotidase